MKNYRFSEQLKRIEPFEKKCSFCEVQESTAMSDNYFAPIYKVKDRTNIVVYSSVKFNKASIGIPRCNRCLKIHKSSEFKSYIYALGIAIAVCGLSYFLFGIVGFIFGIGIGLATGIISQMGIEKKLVLNKGIFTKREGTEQNELVQESLNNGWTLNKPSPKD